MTVALSAILTGDADGLSDLTLVCSSIDMTLRESTSCFVSLVVSFAQLDDVIARPNGTIDIYKTVNGGTPSLMVSTNQQGARIDRGASSRSYRLTGTTTASFTPFDTVDLYPEDVITDRLLSDGRKSWQINPAVNVMPGDSIDYYETETPDNYDIDIVSVVANGKQLQVLITEAAA